MSINNENGAEEMTKSYNTRQCLELACAAQRLNNDYVKEMVPVYDNENGVRYYKQPNKIHMLYSLGAINWGSESDPRMMPVRLSII